jgi:hypothetical protein
MELLIAAAVMITSFVAVFAAGFAIGRDWRSGQTWTDGYVAGLDHTDQMWPAVRRWEMTSE